MIFFAKQSDKSVFEDAIARIAEGDTEALSVIYEKMGRMIMAVANSVLCDRIEAEDVLQDTMCEIVKSCTRYQKNTNARAWILAIARNLALTRAKQRSKICELDENISASDDISNAIIKIDLDSALSKLSVSDREILCLRLETELSYKEISQLTGLTVHAAQKRYRRALDRLRNYLSPMEVK